MPSLGVKLSAAWQAFRKPSLIVDLLNSDKFEDYEVRLLRYEIFFAFYENTAYDNTHNWAKKYRSDYGLYKYVRNIYNPAYRLCEFHHTHLWGGALDPGAGDGTTIPSALPILTDNEDLRPAIAQLWKDSHWQINKDLVTLYGPIMGDFGMRVVDDPVREKVYIDPIHPSMIKDVNLDAWGNVKEYELEEWRGDPEGTDKRVLYNETATRDGDLVVFRTFKDGNPFDWEADLDDPGEDTLGPEWAEPYGFTPFVFGVHNNVGMKYGWSELHPFRSKVHELDDLASMLDDQIRKTVSPMWLFSGVQDPKSSPTTSGADPTSEKRQPGREEIPALYGGKEAKAQALVAELDIPGVSNQINDILKELERDYPELQSDFLTQSSDISGRALRELRRRAQDKTKQRRPNYDSRLVRAQQMSIAIGGEKKYEGYDGFNLESFDKGDLDHLIGPRPVFAPDPIDDIEIERAFWEATTIAVQAGVPLEIHLERQGWSEEDVEKVTTANRRAQAIGERGAQQSLLEAVGQQMAEIRGRRAGENIERSEGS